MTELIISQMVNGLDEDVPRYVENAKRSLVTPRKW
jgi:hypothetical protein